jgi:DNA-binding LytR/AlgR family response regulator
MTGMSGFDVLAAVGAKPMSAVILVAAHDCITLRAFEGEALDYLLARIGLSLSFANASRA